MKGNELVLDAAGCYWFPSTGYGAPEDRLEIAYDDIRKLPEYDHLVPGTYDLVITFADLNSTEYTIPLTVEDELPNKSLDLSDLRVDGTTVSGFSTDTTSYTMNVPNNQSSVTVTATAVDEKATVTIAGGNNLAVGDNTITVTVTAEDGLTSKVYTITVKRAAASGDGGNSNNNGNSNGNSNGSEGGGTVAPTVDNKQTLPANIGGTARFMNNAVTITVPAGATEKPLTITVEKVLNPSQLVTSKDVLLSLVYDEVKKGWVEIGGKVSNDQITAEIDQFAKVAVFAVNNKSVENPESEPVDNVDLKLSDIAGHWAEASIQELAAKGIVSGYADGTFKPKGEVTRAEFAVMLARMLNMQGNGATLEFTDSASIGAWAKEGIAQAVQAGIVNGYGDSSFRPNARISRTEMVTMIANALGIVDNDKTRTAFADDADIPAWAKSAVAATVESGIVQGMSGNKFAPKQTATRAEAAVILLKALAFVGK
ncbi:Endo-1,4-beta-xylanase A precursor [compost metagenome]